MPHPSSILRICLPGIAAIALGYLAGVVLRPPPVWSERPAVVVESAKPVASPVESVVQKETPKLPRTGNRFDDAFAHILEAPEGPEREERLKTFVATLAGNDFSEAITRAVVSRENLTFITVAVFRKWAEAQPAKAIDRTRTLTHQKIPENLWEELLRDWATRDSAEASGWATMQRAGKRQRESVVVVAKVIAKDRPAEAIALLHNTIPRNPDTKALEEILEQWSATDFEAASNRAFEEPGIRSRRAMLQGVMKNMSKRPPAEAVEWADQIPDTGIRNEMLSAQLKRWMKEDPFTAVDFIVKLPRTSARWSSLYEGINGLVKSDLKKAWEIYARLQSPGDRSMLVRALIKESLVKNVQEGLARIQELPEADRGRAIITAVGVIAKDSVPRAMELLETMPPGKDRETAINVLARQWATFDPAAATEFCLKNDSGAGYYRPVLQQIAAWGQKDLKAALAWVNQLEDEKKKEEFIPTILGAGKREESLEAASKMSPTLYAKTARYVVTAWSYQDEKAATAWALKCETPLVRETVIDSLASVIHYRGEANAKTWLNTLSGTNYDVAAARVAGAFAESSPASAMEMAVKISDARSRLLAAETVARKWQEKDPAAAAKWINASPHFDAAARQRLITQ